MRSSQCSLDKISTTNSKKLRELMNKQTEAQIESSTRAILAFVNANKKQKQSDLLQDEADKIFLVVSLKKIHPNPPTSPFAVAIPHAAAPERVCLLTKDPQADYKQKLAAAGVDCIDKVISVKKLKKYSQFEARRQLCASYDLFLADKPILPLLPSLLGKSFFEKKKIPVPVNLSKKDIKKELESVIASTFVHLNKGPSISVKIGTSALNPTQLAENIAAALPAISAKIYGGIENIQSVSVKSATSIALPIYNSIHEKPQDTLKEEMDSDSDKEVVVLPKKKQSAIKKDQNKLVKNPSEKIAKKSTAGVTKKTKSK